MGVKNWGSGDGPMEIIPQTFHSLAVTLCKQILSLHLSFFICESKGNASSYTT